ncbi:hypothetical protein [uncultured Tenacibaculum sp.]|uniref:hypothetical protein n=1 Tax=uncultured Tenacibaculum sp. TaxID=174713 RepID=UPI0026313620|nr:hypothetical protein [uncultured Tenacibaculum sp.]
MATIDWNKLAEQAGNQTDAEFNQQITQLTNLNLTEVDSFISESKITNDNALKVLKVIDNATLSNNEKANSISTIENGIGFLVKLASKVI